VGAVPLGKVWQTGTAHLTGDPLQLVKRKEKKRKEKKRKEKKRKEKKRKEKKRKD